MDNVVDVAFDDINVDTILLLNILRHHVPNLILCDDVFSPMVFIAELWIWCVDNISIIRCGYSFEFRIRLKLDQIISAGRCIIFPSLEGKVHK